EVGQDHRRGRRYAHSGDESAKHPALLRDERGIRYRRPIARAWAFETEIQRRQERVSAARAAHIQRRHTARNWSVGGKVRLVKPLTTHRTDAEMRACLTHGRPEIGRASGRERG